MTDQSAEEIAAGIAEYLTAPVLPWMEVAAAHIRDRIRELMKDVCNPVNADYAAIIAKHHADWRHTLKTDQSAEEIAAGIAEYLDAGGWQSKEIRDAGIATHIRPLVEEAEGRNVVKLLEIIEQVDEMLDKCDALEERLRRAEEELRDIYRRIASSPKGSTGSIGNRYLAVFDRVEIDKKLKALEATDD